MTHAHVHRYEGQPLTMHLFPTYTDQTSVRPSVVVRCACGNAGMMLQSDGVSWSWVGPSDLETPQEDKG